MLLQFGFARGPWWCCLQHRVCAVLGVPSQLIPVLSQGEFVPGMMQVGAWFMPSCPRIYRAAVCVCVGRSGKSPVPPLPFTPFHFWGLICAFSPRLAQLHTCCWLWISILVTPLRVPSVGDNLEKSVRSENR